MIIFLYGPDEYRILHKKREIIKEFGKKYSSIGVEHFDFSEEEKVFSFLNFARNQSIFEPSKLAVIENIFEADIFEELKSFLLNSRLTILIISKEAPLKKYNFLLDPPVVSQRFERLSGALLESFVAKEAKDRGFYFEPAALKFIATAHQGDAWRIATELDMLASLGKKIITREDLENLGLELTPDFWRVTNAFRGDMKDRFFALEYLFSKNEAPAKIFNILSSVIKEKTSSAAELDVLVKSGKIEYEEALLSFCL